NPRLQGGTLDTRLARPLVQAARHRIRAARRCRRAGRNQAPAAGGELIMSARAAELVNPARAWRSLFPHVDSGVGGLWALIIVSALVVLPPFFYVIESSVVIPLPGFRTALGFDNYRRVFEISGFKLWS